MGKKWPCEYRPVLKGKTVMADLGQSETFMSIPIFYFCDESNHCFYPTEKKNERKALKLFLLSISSASNTGKLMIRQFYLIIISSKLSIHPSILPFAIFAWKQIIGNELLEENIYTVFCMLWNAEGSALIHTDT